MRKVSMHSIKIIACVIFCAAALWCSMSRAADCYYIGDSNQFFSNYDTGSFNSGYWQNVVPPGAGDNAIFGSPKDAQGNIFSLSNGNNSHMPHYLYFGNYRDWRSVPYPGEWLTPGHDTAINDLNILSDNWTFDLSSGWRLTPLSVADQITVSLTVSRIMLSRDAIDIYDGLGKQVSSLTVKNGCLHSTFVTHLAGVSNGDATLTVTGSNATWTTDSYVDLGWVGTGKIIIENGATFNVAGNIYAGIRDGSSGTLDILNGSKVYSQAGIYIGDGHESTGSAYGYLHVSGGSYLECKAFSVGSLGNGSAYVTDGGTISSQSGWVGGANSASGAVTVSGSGSTWTNSGEIRIGDWGTGTLKITDGGAVSNDWCHIGANIGAAGSVTVTGKDSTWTNRGDLRVGESGSGTLKITDGGKVSNTYCYIGTNAEATGTVTIEGKGSTWTNSDIFAVGKSGMGTLRITDGGFVSNQAYGYIGYDVGSVGTATVSGTDSTWTSNGMSVGFYGTGTLDVTNGGTVNGLVYIGSQGGSVGYVTVSGTGSTLNGNDFLSVGVNGGGKLSVINGGRVNTPSTGVLSIGLQGGNGNVTVDGIGSICDIAGRVSVGRFGNGMLSITNGGKVINGTNGYVGGCEVSTSSSATGIAKVSGSGSTWTNAGDLYVGLNGTGTLSITKGGKVSAANVSINSTSLLALDVGHDSLLSVDGGTGTITNSGIVRMTAGAGVQAGEYSPISAGTWSGSGIWQAIGGKWISSSNTFVVSDAAASDSGSATSIDLSTTQRISVSDTATGKSVSASFLDSTAPSTISFTATTASGSILSDLQTTAGQNETILSSWLFSTEGYAVSSNSPVYLSMLVGPDHSLDDLELWHHDTTSGWSEYQATDLTYDGTYASFTVTGFSGYAITAVPEPSTIALLVAGVLGVVLFSRKKRRG